MKKEIPSYETIIQNIKDSPKTWLMGILACVVEQCYRHTVFVPGGMDKFISQIMKGFRRS